KRAGGILLCPEERGRRAAPWKKKLALAAATIAKIDAPTLRRSDAPTLRRSDAPTLRRSDAPTLRRSDALIVGTSRAPLFPESGSARQAENFGWRNSGRSRGAAVAHLPGRVKSVTKTGVIDYIQKGGMLMWPILVCSIVSIAVF